MSSRILLVDDDRLLREVIGEFLSSAGYDVDLSDCGETALQQFVAGKYKLAIIDQGMKKMTGLNLMKELRAVDQDIFCLMMTGYANLNKVYNGIEKGVSDYIIKPFQLLELLNIVQKYI